MKLTELTISLNRSYDKNPGQYTAKIEYQDKGGKVELQLDERVSNALLLCIGECVTEFAAAAAVQIKQSVIASVAEAKSAPQIEVESVA